VSGEQAPPDVQACLDEVVDALGARDFLASAGPDELSAALSPIRAFFLQAVDLLTDPTRAPGWTSTDVELLQSQGHASGELAPRLRSAAKDIDGLDEALSRPGAAFLDVGVGVGGLAIAMCRLWPSLRSVGIDPWEYALELARRNVAAADLSDRIELRRQGVEELADEAAFDLAWLPAPFLARSVLELALARVLAALRPGGLAIIGMYRGADTLGTALARLRTARSGGAVLTGEQAEDLLRQSGFVDVRTLPEATWALALLVVGRRPVSG
jgi:precorrin-6B methylase 2